MNERQQKILAEGKKIYAARDRLTEDMIAHKDKWPDDRKALHFMFMAGFRLAWLATGDASLKKLAVFEPPVD